MGKYVNPGVEMFRKSVGSEVYVDKSNLIVKTNALVDTEKRFICISRPRRFGKTMAASMLSAYYGADSDARPLFDKLNIAKDPNYEKFLNKCNVIMINMQMFLTRAKMLEKKIAREEAKKEVTKKKKILITDVVETMIEELTTRVTKELNDMYPEIYNDDFIDLLTDVYIQTGCPFVILIDEWDCVLRENKESEEAHKIYLDFLRLLFKDQAYVGLAYMTGILPIKKYGSHSALNMFSEYSMTDPGEYLRYFGFEEKDVEKLSKKYGMDMDEMERWYNGYFVDLGMPIYNPTSVTSSLRSKRFSNYWNQTETYEALKVHIEKDFDGLKEKVTLMLAGESIKIDTRSFINDMTTFKKADDVLTLLAHLGYLSYNFEEKTVRIPNKEVKEEFQTSIEVLKWEHVVVALENADKVLKAIWNQEANMVAEKIEEVHEKNVSILKYNDENSLSSVIGLALYTAIDYYTVIREIPSGKGYADIVYIPRKKHVDKPALVVELKWNKTVEGAIDQIKKKNYTSALEEYEGNLLLVGVNYDTKTKKHECVIESWQM